MSHGLLWLPLLLAFVLLAALGWLERRRQSLFRAWAEGAELVKLDGSGGAQLKNGRLVWCRFEAGKFQEHGDFDVCRLELVELMALASGDAPLTDESQGPCRLRLVGKDLQMDVPFSDAERARRWGEQLMARARCDL
ncbi:MAG: hypothetical protein ISQ52_03945 [Synechococcus sp. BS307-5m-G38]|nr:hypothetical protein [Synechococcus sp. BS307-5m-G38]|tara:strand:+ start:136 stop:546 length:411 start_codon:yes stop_codon:yes gene_type:complete